MDATETKTRYEPADVVRCEIGARALLIVSV